MNLKGNKEGYIGEFGGKIGNRENYIILLKNKRYCKKENQKPV